VKKEVIPVQFSAGLAGLGLLRTWPFLEVEEAHRRLDELQAEASNRERGHLEIDPIADGYARWSSTYETNLNPLLVLEETAVRDGLTSIPVGSALDVACGTGRITRLLHHLGHDTLGVDASDAMLAIARRAAPALRFVRGSMDALPFEDASFDLVVCALALTHAHSLASPMLELARVLRPGGRLLISDVHPFAVATGAHAFFRDESGVRHVVRNELHWHGDYIRAFTQARLTIEHCWEPLFTKEVLDAFLSKGSTPQLKHLIDLPYVLAWTCTKRST
jgi:SAM-dependent methyltransferase